jgi:hypothetical protein
VYPPRLKLHPEQISTDENGISLVVGLTAASLDPFGPAPQLKRAEPAGVSLAQLAGDRSLHVAVAPKILEPLTQMVVDRGIANLDLLDIPEPLFAKLADRSTLQEIIPDLKRYGEELKVRSTLRVVSPLSIGNPPQPAEVQKQTEPSEDKSKPVAKTVSKPLELRVPGLRVDVSIQTTSHKNAWQPCASFDLNVADQIVVEIVKPSHDRRGIRLNWLSASSLNGGGRFADGYQSQDKTLHVDRYIELFRSGWGAYLRGATVSEVDVSDVTIGASKLRLHEVNWESPIVDVAYKLGRIKLTNLSKEDFRYETKAPTSNWGEPLILKPGDSHEFELPYPLTYRRNGPQGPEVYTLNVGSHSEFRVPITGGPPRLFAAKQD